MFSLFCPSVDLKGEGKSVWDIIMWMDHRAKSEAARINETGHPVLGSIGGAISVEMQTPKLLWLKQNKPDVWKKCAHFFDLSDFLTLKATGSMKRSLCSAVCKWTYNGDGSKDGWVSSFFERIGLEDLVKDRFEKIGKIVIPPGSFIDYMSEEVVEKMGLGM